MGSRRTQKSLVNTLLAHGYKADVVRKAVLAAILAPRSTLGHTELRCLAPQDTQGTMGLWERVTDSVARLKITGLFSSRAEGGEELLTSTAQTHL